MSFNVLNAPLMAALVSGRSRHSSLRARLGATRGGSFGIFG